jgi:hypothetical protein
MKADIPSRKKIKLEWFKSEADFQIERKTEIQYNANSVLENKHTYNVYIKYILTKKGEPKDLPSGSPITLYKGELPFLFLSTSATIGNKIISEKIIDADITIDDDIIEIKEGKPEITFEDALKPKEHVEVRTRYDEITRRIVIENKLDNKIKLKIHFKQTKDVAFVSAIPEPTETKEPVFIFDLSISSEETKKITLKLRAKIVKRVTRIKPEFIREEKLPKYRKRDQ